MADSVPGPIDYETPGLAADVSAVAVGTIGLTLLGFQLLIGSLAGLYAVLSFAMATPFAGMLRWSILVGFGLHLAGSIALIAFAMPIARRLFGKLSRGPIDLCPPASMSLIVAGVGFYFFLGALDEGVAVVARLVTRFGGAVANQAQVGFDAGDGFAVAVPLAKLGIGAFLFLSPGAIVGRWARHVRA